jgi:ubiquitin carboxyl-terminal hydrolase 16/45
MKKGYGRLSSYTVVDNLFGGHLLSSIICQECRSCVVRLEPILDLSLPIVDDDSLEFESNKRDLPGRSCKAKAKANNTPVKPPSSPTPLSKEAAAFKKSDPVSLDNSKLSKHQLKKMKKDSKKTKVPKSYPILVPNICYLI